MYQISCFDRNQATSLKNKDSSEDGKFDTVYYFDKGEISASIHDMEADGRVNIWQKYKKNKPLERKVDAGGDGRLERIVLYEAQGLSEKSHYEVDQDVKMETFQR